MQQFQLSCHGISTANLTNGRSRRVTTTCLSFGNFWFQIEMKELIPFLISSFSSYFGRKCGSTQKPIRIPRTRGFGIISSSNKYSQGSKLIFFIRGRANTQTMTMVLLIFSIVFRQSKKVWVGHCAGDQVPFRTRLTPILGHRRFDRRCRSLLIIGLCVSRRTRNNQIAE